MKKYLAQLSNYWSSWGIGNSSNFPHFSCCMSNINFNITLSFSFCFPWSNNFVLSHSFDSTMQQTAEIVEKNANNSNKLSEGLNFGVLIEISIRFKILPVLSLENKMYIYFLIPMGLSFWSDLILAMILEYSSKNSRKV